MLQSQSKTLRWLAIGLLGVLPAAGAAAQSTGAKFQGIPVRPGETISVTVPLSATEKVFAAIEGNRVPTNAVAVLAVPRGFDPRQSWPVLIVFSTSDSRRENRGDIPFYLREALAENWLVLTGDGPEFPRRDTTGWRAAMTLAALDALHRSFPGSDKWPLACAGISGGAKRACLLAPLLAKMGNRIAGLYLAGINEDLLAEGYGKFHPERDFLNTKVFITSGRRDKIATPAQTERVRRSFEKEGFRQVRLEAFPEAHNVKRPLTLAALRWFRGTPLEDGVRNDPGFQFTVQEIEGRASGEQKLPSRGVSNQTRRRIAITLSDPSRKASPITAQVYFIARRSSDTPRFIYAHADLTLNLRGSAEARTEVEVPELKPDRPKKSPPLGFVFTGVGKADGWIAIAQTNGETFQVRASSPALLEVGEGKSRDSLEALAAAYRSGLKE